LTGQGDESSRPEDRAAPQEADAPRLRRSLIGGYRPADVNAALLARGEELDELRQDLAALWLAFGEHERAIRALEDATVPRTEPPVQDSRTVDEQLTELDEVLTAIEQATRTLQRSHAEEGAEPEHAEDEAGERAGKDR
jgi:hypothetical protein